MSKWHRRGNERNKRTIDTAARVWRKSKEIWKKREQNRQRDEAEDRMQNRPRRSRDRKLKYLKLIMCILLRAAMSYESNQNWINPIPASKSVMQIVCAVWSTDYYHYSMWNCWPCVCLHWIGFRRLTEHHTTLVDVHLVRQIDFRFSSSSQHLILLLLMFLSSPEKWNEIRQHAVCSICFCAGN